MAVGYPSSALTVPRELQTLSVMEEINSATDNPANPEATRPQQWLAVLLLILFFIALSIIFHTLPCSTPMNGLTDAQWDARVKGHLETYPFFRRLPVTHLVVGLRDLTGLTTRQSFYTLEYLILFIASIFFYRFLRQIKFDFGWSMAGLAVFLASYPVLLGFSEPVHTWDDLWTYAALIYCMSALYRGKMIAAILAFTVALYAREQTLTFYPLFIAGVWLFGGRWKVPMRILFLFIPALLFAPFFLPGWSVPAPAQFIVDINWGSPGKSANSIFSLIMSFGVIWITWLLGIVAFFSDRLFRADLRNRFLLYGSLYAVAVTLLVVTQVGFMRETRLFFVPFIWVIPVSLWWIRKCHHRMLAAHLWVRGLATAVVITSIVLCLPLGATLFPVLDYRNCPDICQKWTGVHIAFAITVIVAALLTAPWSRRRSQLGPV